MMETGPMSVLEENLEHWVVSMMGSAPYYGCIALWTTEAVLAGELAALLHL